MADRVLLVLLALFFLLYGLAHVTNVRVVWMEPLCGLAALAAGAVCLFRALAR